LQLRKFRTFDFLKSQTVHLQTQFFCSSINAASACIKRLSRRASFFFFFNFW
jgi:hypothetical protein